ncbi:hypothetical protein LMG27177_00342 [Paraburkholderia fynbosensis]|uniref:mRNA interferase HigB n=1 Tax=Paraburkholderia fynbosensis TaxID=1200993 RepID=A0A6J5FGM2_9BURK|nr:hypothetical protein LMG27177_00342 [Paraburkholderia fynbosensis]
MREYVRTKTTRVMSKKALQDFIKRHPGCAQCAIDVAVAQACLAYGHNDLKQTFASVDYVPPQYIVFRCGRQLVQDRRGDSLQQAVVIRSSCMTHAEYDLWTRKNLNS